MSGLSFEGVPRSLVIDGWWLNEDARFESASSGFATRELWIQRSKRRMFLFVLLLALADNLFFQQALGISIAVFCVAVFVASVMESGRFNVSRGPIAVLLASVLPVIEYAQFVAVCIAIWGLIVSVAWQRIGSRKSYDAVLYAAQRMMLYLPIGAFQSFDAWLRAPSEDVDITGMFRGFLRNWAFPVGGGLLIASLLIAANPVLEQMLADITDFDVDLHKLVVRLCFWMGAALAIWPFLGVVAQRLERPIVPAQVRRVWGWGLNAQSVSNALWVFNGLLAVQLVMDGSFVVGGQLPYDMSYAEYAHRGAYPLVATALLAGCFALAARPFLDEGRWLKPLMVLWLSLNGLLTLSSMYRLDLYVDAYGLTYLRVRAGIWMVLVALWLGLIGWQIVRAKANDWLVMRSFGMGLMTIYAACFVNFAEIITAHNYAKFGEVITGDYDFCDLMGSSKTANLAELLHENCGIYFDGPEIDGWRDWGFREWRVARYVKSVQAKGVADENLGGR